MKHFHTKFLTGLESTMVHVNEYKQTSVIEKSATSMQNMLWSPASAGDSCFGALNMTVFISSALFDCKLTACL